MHILVYLLPRWTEIVSISDITTEMVTFAFYSVTTDQIDKLNPLCFVGFQKNLGNVVQRTILSNLNFVNETLESNH